MLTSVRGRMPRTDLQKQELNGKFCPIQHLITPSQKIPENRTQRVARERGDLTFQARYNRELFSFQRPVFQLSYIFPKTHLPIPKKFHIQERQNLAYLSTKIPFTNISSSYYFSRIKFFTRAALSLTRNRNAFFWRFLLLLFIVSIGTRSPSMEKANSQVKRCSFS